MPPECQERDLSVSRNHMILERGLSHSDTIACEVFTVRQFGGRTVLA